MSRQSKADPLGRGQNPPDSDYTNGVLNWINLALTEAVAANKAQFNYDKIGAVIDAIMGVDEPIIRSTKLSGIRYNKLQKVALEQRSMLTDIKVFWDYKANSKRFEKQAEVFQKLSKNWFLRRGIDQVFRDTIDYTMAAGSGYLHMYYDTELPGPTDIRGTRLQGDINARAEDPRDVFPFRWNGSDKRTLQSCKGVFIRRERPTSWLKEFYGAAAAKVQMDRMGFEKESPSQRHQREVEDSVMSTGPHFQGPLFGGQPAARLSGPMPITDEVTVYLYDSSINESNKPKEVGDFIDAVGPDGQRRREPANSWSYVVQPGEPLFPFGRRIVATRYCVLSDGPNHFQHGMLPVCKLTPDTWAWSFIGTSPLQGLLSMQRSLDETLRAIQNHVRRANNRKVLYDKKAVAPGVARKINTELPGGKIAINPHAAGPKGAIMFADEPPLDPANFEWLKFLLDGFDELAGTAALKQISQLGQLPSTETIDKIIENMTPLVRARSRSLEVFVREFAMMLASMFLQFYTLDLRLRILGADGVTQQDWDYKAGDMLPDYIDDDDYDDSGSLRPEALEREPAPDHIRNREFLRFFDFDIAPDSLLDAATITKKLLYIQLSRMGLVDHWTLLEVLGVPNVGKPPSWATDITKRLQAEKLLGLGVIASTVGRPPSAQQMPSLNTSGGGISESG